MTYNINEIRNEFPALNQQVNGKQLIYFDSAATTLKPQSVIDEIKRYYEHENSNIHRGTHFLSQKATEAFEDSRKYIAKYLKAKHDHEVIFVRGATEGVNLVANSFGEAFLSDGDEIIISTMEHHSNIVPWQMICERKNANLKIIPLLENHSIDIEAYKKLISKKTKLIAITHVSNALGVIVPIKEVIEIAHTHNIPVLLDGAQGIVHNSVDVQELDCDFYCFSGHKFYGPMGIGVVYGKEKYLEAMPPYQGGGEMIKDVSFEKTTWNNLPFKFEAGTPNVSAVLGLKKAVQFVESIGIEQIIEHESDLLEYLSTKMESIENAIIYGKYVKKAGVLSFNIRGVHHYDLGVLLDKMGIAVRTGHHCAQPLMNYLSVPGTIRVSLGMYNTKEEIDTFINALRKTMQMLM